MNRNLKAIIELYKLSNFLRELVDEIKKSNELEIETEQWKLPFKFKDNIEVEIDKDHEELEIELEFQKAPENQDISVA